MSICKTCHNKPFFYTDAPDVQAYCPDCGKAHDLKKGGDAVMNEKAMPFPTPTDTLTSPEPASAEVGAQFKPTDLEAGWAEAAIKMQDQGVPRAVASAIHGAVEEALAAVEAELIQIYEERDSVIKNSLEVTAGLEKAKEDSELLDWVEQTKGQMIIDTDTLIPPKWFITDPHNKVLAHRCDTVRQAIRSAIVASKENK